jgi:hypothetical protein
MKKRVGYVTPFEAREQSKADKANWRRKIKQAKEKKFEHNKHHKLYANAYTESGHWGKNELQRLLELQKQYKAGYDEYKFPDGSGSKLIPRQGVVKFEFTPDGSRVYGYPAEYDGWKQEYAGDWDIEVVNPKPVDNRTDAEKFADKWVKENT